MKFFPSIQKFLALLAVISCAGLAHAQPAPADAAPAKANAEASATDSKQAVKDEAAGEAVDTRSMANDEPAADTEEGADDAAATDEKAAGEAVDEAPASAEELAATNKRMAAHEWQLGMRLPASPVMEKIYHFHHYMLVLITVVSVFVLCLMIYVCVRFSEKNNPKPSKTSHNTLIEIIWTLVPVLILVCVAYPSLHYLYYMDKSEIDGKADLTIKIVGYQWYWNYEYPEAGIKFDSYLVKEDDLKEGDMRLLTVDNAVYVPVHKKVRIQLTGGDVIHSWAMPNFGVKMDAVPGHLNETWFQADVQGTYYGQCSELCGVNHGFMPIVVHVVSQEEFDAWLAKAKEEFAASIDAPQQYAALR